MKTTVSRYDFERAFVDADRKENFSYEALGLLFDYFEDDDYEEQCTEAVRDYLNDNTQLVGETSTGFVYLAF